jgi:hypothetical protein
VLVAPADETYEDRVVLEWRTDESDRLTYEVTWSVDGEPTLVETEDTSIDLTESVAAGDVVEWTITPSDRWGPGETTSGSFTVLAIPDAPKPEETGGCATTRGPGALDWLAALLTLSALRTRNASRRTRSGAS